MEGRTRVLSFGDVRLSDAHEQERADSVTRVRDRKKNQSQNVCVLNREIHAAVLSVSEGPLVRSRGERAVYLRAEAGVAWVFLVSCISRCSTSKQSVCCDAV